MRTTATIHRSSMTRLHPLCGSLKGHVSMSGVGVTCPDCLRLTTPLSREEAMVQIEMAVRR